MEKIFFSSEIFVFFFVEKVTLPLSPPLLYAPYQIKKKEPNERSRSRMGKSFPDRYILFPGWGGFQLELKDTQGNNTVVKHSDMWSHVGPFASKKPLEGTYRLYISNPENKWQKKYTVTNITESGEEGVEDKEVTLTSNGKDFCTVEYPGKLVIKITNENDNEDLDMWTVDRTRDQFEDHLVGWEKGTSRQMYAELPDGEEYRMTMKGETMHLASENGNRASLTFGSNESEISVTLPGEQEPKEYCALYADFDDSKHNTKLVYALKGAANPLKAEKFIFRHYDLHDRALIGVPIVVFLLGLGILLAWYIADRKGERTKNMWGIGFFFFVVPGLIATVAMHDHNHNKPILNWDPPQID